MQRTAEQLEILDAATDSTDNLMVSAYAGTGKTTTLKMLETAVDDLDVRPILYLVFNKANKEKAQWIDEAQYDRMTVDKAPTYEEECDKRMLMTTPVKTFNGMGHGIWQNTIDKKLVVNSKKDQEILRSLINEVPKKEQGAIWDCFWEVIHGVALAKALGYLPDGKYTQYRSLIARADFHTRLDEDPDDLTADLIDTVLFRSIKAAFTGSIDYNDQVYMPAIFGGIFPKFPFVMVDEYQDLNAVNHVLVDKLARTRLVGVGDDAQSIYAFRGAVQGGMATAQAKHKMRPLTLSTSFRCPQAIVENARWRVPNFNWVKPGGHVETLEELHPQDISDDAVFLCRNNAPILRMAMRLLSSGRSVRVSGSDIGPKLIGLMRKLGPENLTREQAKGAVNDWLLEKKAKGHKTAEDMAACMDVFIERGSDLAQAIRYAEHVLSQDGAIRLMTGHKAKGLEFETVYHLDPWLCREDEQDRNLRYVIQTRSLNTYYEIDGVRVKWE